MSVIVPTYQRRGMVERAVASVLSQSFEDLELIVIDDGSSDGSGASLTRMDNRLRYRWQHNQGVAAARNVGLAMARGDILAFLDSDDRWLPDHLEVVTEVLDRLPQAVLVTTSPRHLCEGRARPSDACLWDPLPMALIENRAGFPSSIAVRRRPAIAAGGFDERLAVGEDGDFFTRLAFRGPFAMLRRRTMVKSYTRGLRRWGVQHGHYLRMFEYRLTKAFGELEELPAVRARQLDAQARGAVAFVRALRALDRGDEPALRATLAQACRLFPQLSREAECVESRLGFLPTAYEPVERLRHRTMTAAAWPRGDADTALYLRCCAVVLALRLGRIRQAAALLAQRPRPTPGFLTRAGPMLARRARQRLYARRHAARDDVDLDARGSNRAAPQ